MQLYLIINLNSFRATKVDSAAFVKCSAKQDIQKLVVVDACLKQSCHEVSEVVFRHYPENRRLTAEEILPATKPVNELQSNPSYLQSFLKSKTGKPLTAKDICAVIAYLCSACGVTTDSWATTSSVEPHYHVMFPKCILASFSRAFSFPPPLRAHQTAHEQPAMQGCRAFQTFQCKYSGLSFLCMQSCPFTYKCASIVISNYI